MQVLIRHAGTTIATIASVGHVPAVNDIVEVQSGLAGRGRYRVIERGIEINQGSRPPTTEVEWIAVVVVERVPVGQ